MGGVNECESPNSLSGIIYGCPGVPFKLCYRVLSQPLPNYSEDCGSLIKVLIVAHIHSWGKLERKFKDPLKYIGLV